MLKVSILIPLYNSEKYIAETIESALNQTYTNIEIIVVDDGSSDNSLNIASKFESDIVRVFSKENKGASSARNSAFQHAKGDLIQYLDADDLLDPDKIKLQVQEYLRYNNPGIVICGVWGRFVNQISKVNWEDQYTNKDYTNPISWLIDSWEGKGMMAQHGWLISRELILKSGLWNESLSLNDDGEFFCRVLLQAEEIKFVSESKVYYRSNISSSLSQSRSTKALQSELDSYKLYSNHILSILDNTKVRRALGQNFLNFAYMYYTKNIKLSNRALKEFYNLRIGKPWPVGSNYFKKIAKHIGFKNTLKLQKIFKR